MGRAEFWSDEQIAKAVEACVAEYGCVCYKGLPKGLMQAVAKRYGSAKLVDIARAHGVMTASELRKRKANLPRCKAEVSCKYYDCVEKECMALDRLYCAEEGRCWRYVYEDRG